MKKRVSLLLAAAMTLTALTGCSSGNDTTLVSKTPFPEFSEVDTEGNQVSSDIFADYDATIVNFWNNGCGTCIEEMKHSNRKRSHLCEHLPRSRGQVLSGLHL